MKAEIIPIDKKGNFSSFVLSPEPKDPNFLQKIADICAVMPSGISTAFGCSLCPARELPDSGLEIQTLFLADGKLAMKPDCNRARNYLASKGVAAQAGLPCSEEHRVLDLQVEQPSLAIPLEALTWSVHS